MNLHFNRDIERLVDESGSKTPVTGFHFKSFDIIPLDLRFTKDGSAYTLSGTSIYFAVKEARTGAVLTGTDAWTLSSGVYSASVPFSTAPINNLLTGSHVDVLVEFSFDDNGSHVSSQTIPGVFERELFSVSESIPPAAPALTYNGAYLIYNS